MSDARIQVLTICMLGVLVGGAVAALTTWGAPRARPISGQAGPTDTPVPALTPLPYTPAPARAADVLSADPGTDAARHARSMAYLPDGSGDLAFTVGGSYPHARAIFVDRPAHSPRGPASDAVLVPLPDAVRGFREVQAIPGSGQLIAGGVHWSRDAGNAFAFHQLYRVEPVSGTVEALLSPGSGFNDFAVAPTGESVVVLTAFGELEWLDLETGQRRTLHRGLFTPAGIAAANLAWTPDGSAIALGIHPAGGGAAVERIIVATGQRDLLAEFPTGHDPIPIYLADGHLRVFVHEARSARAGYGVRVVAIGAEGVDGTEVLTELPAPQRGGYIDAPALHPDGQRVLYRRDGGVFMLRVDVPDARPVRIDRGEYATAGPVVGASAGATEAAWVVRISSGTQEGTASAPSYEIRRLVVEEGGGS